MCMFAIYRCIYIYMVSISVHGGNVNVVNIYMLIALRCIHMVLRALPAEPRGAASWPRGAASWHTAKQLAIGN